ncbi:hypothetical protein ACFWY5_06235 [Nonomuraea sp. NPDC059007]|uniref:hypothetical protein n=1 Tax=Nonomuraea sp. NPDC059007 TaxID=3346692 RepID=UPI0036AC1BF4
MSSTTGESSYRLMISGSASWPGLVEAAAQAMAAVLPSAAGLPRRAGRTAALAGTAEPA